MRTVVIFVMAFFIVGSSHSRTIVIPGEAASVEEAVRMAASGDVIYIQAETVDLCAEIFTGGLLIVGKEITITGMSLDTKTALNAQSVAQMPGVERPSPLSPQTSSIWIEDASVTLRNLRMNRPLEIVMLSGSTAYYYGAPIFLQSGSLDILDCDLHSNIECHSHLRVARSTIQGHSFQNAQYNSRSTEEPCLYVSGGDGLRIEIVDSTVDCGGGYNAVLLDSSIDAEFTVLQSNIIGGPYYMSSSNHSSVSSKKGGYGMTVRDCANVRLRLQESRVVGGKGTPMDGDWLSSNPPTDSELFSGDGGDGLALENSTWSLEGGTFIGGDGGDSTPIFEDHGPREYMISGGDGGSGISLMLSRLSYRNVVVQGGGGGSSVVYKGVQLPAGNDGAEWFVDADSEATPLSCIPDWMLLYK